MTEKSEDPNQAGQGLWLDSVKEGGRTIIWALVVVMVIRTFIIEPFKIPSGSMIPNLKIGDFIFVSKFSYGLEMGFRDNRIKLAPFARPNRGDIIVFIFPNDPSLHYIKRVVGLPGDRIRIENTVVWINGEPSRLEPVQDRSVLEGHGDASDLSQAELYKEYLPGMTEPHLVLMDPINRNPYGGASENFPEKIVPEDHYFALGDNRDHSADSRSWGFVPYKLIKGRAQIVWLSYNSREPLFSIGNFGIPSLRWRRAFHLIR